MVDKMEEKVVFHLDDDQDDLDMLSITLTGAGYKVFSHLNFETFETTLAEMSTQKQRIDLFIFDRFMTDNKGQRMDTLDDPAQIALFYYPQIPFIAYTGFFDAHLMCNIVAAGNYSSVVDKSDGTYVLLDEINKVLTEIP